VILDVLDDDGSDEDDKDNDNNSDYLAMLRVRMSVRASCVGQPQLTHASACARREWCAGALRQKRTISRPQAILKTR
jgi:hypothetical protein